MNSPDYTSYSINELEDIYQNIDRESYPDRFEQVSHQLAKKKNRVIKNHEFIADSDDESSVLNFNTQTIFPKFTLNRRLIRNLILITTVATLLSWCFKLPLILALCISVILMIMLVTFKVANNWNKYFKFLNGLGTSTTKVEFMAQPSIKSLVPFAGSQIMCSCRIGEETLLFGKQRNYRVINLEDVESFELKIFHGCKIVKVRLKVIDNRAELYLPWNDEMERIATLMKKSKKLVSES